MGNGNKLHELKIDIGSENTIVVDMYVVESIRRNAVSSIDLLTGNWW